MQRPDKSRVIQKQVYGQCTWRVQADKIIHYREFFTTERKDGRAPQKIIIKEIKIAGKNKHVKKFKDMNDSLRIPTSKPGECTTIIARTIQN